MTGTCAKCGRDVPVPEGYGVTFLCEFFYCRDREDCRAACEASGRQFETPGERMWREMRLTPAERRLGEAMKAVQPEIGEPIKVKLPPR